MKKIIYCILFVGFFNNCIAQNATALQINKSRIKLPNGWSLSPIGKSLPLGDLPLNIAVSPSKKLLAVTNNGQSTQSLQLIDATKHQILDSIDIPASWLGLAFSKDEKTLYASGGNDNWILEYAIQKNKLLLKDSIKLGDKWPTKISPAGLTINYLTNTLFVVTKDNNSLYTIDLGSKKITSQLALPAEAYTCLLSSNKKQLYISIWGDESVLVYDIASKKIMKKYKVGSHPNDMVLNKKGNLLFVANANDNSVSIIDLQKNKIAETLNTALYPDAPTGSTTNALAISEDDKKLYIANADNNCLAVFDISKYGNSISKGFIPVGWYPTAVKVIGNTIFVANGKGYTSHANPYGPDPYKKRGQLGFQLGLLKDASSTQYIGGLMKGTLSIFQQPTDAQLAIYSKAVYDNTPYNKEKELLSGAEKGNPIPQKVGDQSPIKYVFYIVKENRTYDQVLGDVKEGNGDPALCLFGENITPNQHALVKDFVLMDNFYVDGEVSADGHNWTFGAYATDYLEKNWVTSYGGRGGTYDAEGTRNIANSKKGFIWDHAKRAGVTYRTYGEFADDYKANLPVLENHFCPYFTSWDQSVRDTTRVGQWKREFDSLYAHNAVPQLNTLRLINDHTEGLRLGKPSPNAHVADNDLAVGMFIEYLSKHPIWNQTAVFIVEDDAQDGPDHIDAHRTTAYVAGGLVKRNFIDHTMYSTSSILKTIELILGIPPMSQYDAAATPLWRCFQSTPNNFVFNAKPAKYDINEKNTVKSAWQQKSETFNFAKEDAIPDRVFTEVIWKAVKGLDAIVPAPKRAAFLKITKEEEEEDDDD
jgi:DNA-binding beta-propeller fold protein YncE